MTGVYLARLTPAEPRDLGFTRGAFSLIVVLGLFLTVDCFTKRPEIALLPE